MLGLFNKEDDNLRRNRKLQDLRNKQQAKYVRPQAEPVRYVQRGAPPLVLYQQTGILGLTKVNSGSLGGSGGLPPR